MCRASAGRSVLDDNRSSLSPDKDLDGARGGMAQHGGHPFPREGGPFLDVPVSVDLS